MDKTISIRTIIGILVFMIIAGIIFYYLPDNVESRKLFDKAVGTYKVDFSASDSGFTKKEKGYYGSTELILRKDGSYMFLGYTPVSHSQSGDWGIIGSDIERGIRFNECCGYFDTDICKGNNCYISFDVPIYIENINSGTKSLAFRKYR